MNKVPLSPTSEVAFIASELERLEMIARNARQNELAHFIGVAGELAKIVLARTQPKPAGAISH